MKLTLAEPKLLKESVAIISELVSEVSFKIDKDKLELIAMDPANVVMVIFRLLGSAFVEYEVEKEEVISVSLDNLNQVLRRVKPNDTIILELDKNKSKLRVNLSGDSNRTFNLRLIEIEEREHKIPSLNFPVRIETSSDVLEGAIEDVSVVAESVAFIANKDKFEVKSEGNVSDARVEILKEGDTEIDVKKEGDVLAKYSIEYLKKIIKGGKLADRVSIEFSKDYPLKVEYNVLDKLGLSFILAPRVSSD